MSPSMFSWHAAASGKHRGQQIVGLHALDRAAAPSCRRGSAAARASGWRPTASACRTSATSSTACSSTSCTRRRAQEPEHIAERKAVLLGQRDVDAVVGRRRLQLEVERPAEALAQRQAPGPLMRPPNGAWMTSCMPPPSSKKRSAMTRGRASARRRARRGRRRCSRRPARRRSESRPQSLLQPRDGSSAAAGRRCPASSGRASGARSLDRLRAPRPTCCRQLDRARRRLAAPERNRRRRAVRVLDEHAAGCRRGGSATTCCRAGRCRRPGSRRRSPRRRCRRRCPRDARRRCTARCRESRRRSVIAAAARRAGRAAGRSRGRDADRRRSVRAARRCLPTASRRRRRSRRAADRDTGRRGGRARTARPRASRSAAHAATICCARMSSGASGTMSRSSSPRRIASTSAAHSISSSRVVAKSRPFGHRRRASGRRGRCAGPPTAIERGDPIWQTRSTVPTSMPSSSDAVATSDAQLAGLQALLGVEPRLARQAAVMRGDGVVRRAARPGDARRARRARRVLTKTSVERCSRTSAAMPVVDLVPHARARRRRPSSLARDLDREIELAPRRDLHDAWQRAGRRRPRNSRDHVDRLSASPTGRCAARGRPASASSRSSDSARCAPRLSSATAWISSTMTVSTAPQHLAAAADVSRMYSDSGVVTRMCGGRSQHRPARGHQRVAGADRGANLRQVDGLRSRASADDLGERAVEVLLDVVAERLERRDVQRPTCGPRACRRRPAGPADRCRPGTPPASCRSRSAPRSACRGRRGSPASRRPAARSASRTASRNHSRTSGCAHARSRRPRSAPVS